MTTEQDRLSDQDRHLIDTITKVTVGPRDILVVTLREGVARMRVIRQIHDQVRAGLQNWNGLIAFPGPGGVVEDVATLSESEGRRVYDALVARFGFGAR